jgi:hypothetical protein
MRCPHCAGEIPAGSRFCGICGRGIAQPGDVHAPAQPGWGAGHPARAQSAVDSVSLFELPSSRSGRRAKLALILVLDAILAGAGVVMLLAYLEARRASRPPAASSDGERGGERGKVEVMPPTQVSPSPGAVPALPASTPAAPAAPGSQPAPAEVEPSRGEAAPDSKARPRSPGKPRPKSGRRDKSDARRGEPSGDTLAGSAPEWESEVTSRLRDVVDSHQQDLERCYLSSTNSDDPDAALEGRIDIRFTLMSDGSAANVSPTANTTGSAELADCVVDLFRSWKFPGGHPEPLELEWPFLFRAPVATAQQ